MQKEDGIWKYCDNKEPVESFERNCGKCGNPNTKEDHDHCLGTLKYAMNACCGHGKSAEAFIQFSNDFRISGLFALMIAKFLK